MRVGQFAVYWDHSLHDTRLCAEPKQIVGLEPNRVVNLGAPWVKVGPSDIIAAYDTIDEAHVGLARAREAWDRLTINVEAAHDVLAVAIKLRREHAKDAANVDK